MRRLRLSWSRLLATNWRRTTVRKKSNRNSSKNHKEYLWCDLCNFKCIDCKQSPYKCLPCEFMPWSKPNSFNPTIDFISSETNNRPQREKIAQHWPRHERSVEEKPVGSTPVVLVVLPAGCRWRSAGRLHRCWNSWSIDMLLTWDWKKVTAGHALHTTDFLRPTLIKGKKMQMFVCTLNLGRSLQTFRFSDISRWIVNL